VPPFFCLRGNFHSNPISLSLLISFCLFQKNIQSTMTITVYPYDPATAPPVPATASDGTTDALSIAVDIYKFYRVKRTASEVVSNSNGIVNKRYCCMPEEYVSRNLVTNKRVRSSSAIHQHHFDDDGAPAMKRARFNNPDEILISQNEENSISPFYSLLLLLLLLLLLSKMNHPKMKMILSWP
jgi:hypothetical protein